MRGQDLFDGVTATGKSVLDIRPAPAAGKGWISDKPKGLAVDGRVRLFLDTDKDGVYDWSGETGFLEPGRLAKLF